MFTSPFADQHVHHPTHTLITAAGRMVVMPPKRAGAVINVTWYTERRTQVCQQKVIPSAYVPPSMCETKFHTHTKQQAKL